MKSLKYLIVVAIMIFACSMSYAQPHRDHGRGGNGDFQEFQMQVLIKQLEIEESKVDSFTNMYQEYSQKMKELRPRHKPGGNKAGAAAPTDAEVEATIMESFDLAEQTTALKREYYNKFKTLLSPHQILKMYNVERRLQERVTSELRERRGGGE